MNKAGSLQFGTYVKMLPSAWVFEHFMSDSSAPRKILSSSMIDATVSEFLSANSLLSRFAKLSDHDKLRCALAYLLGDLGLSVDGFSGLDDPLVQSFLVYAASDTLGNFRYFGFDEFEPSLRGMLAQTIVDQARAADQPPVLPSGSDPGRSLDDVIVVAGLGAHHLLRKKRNNGLTRTALTQVRKLIHEVDQGDFVTRALLAYAVEQTILYESELDYHPDTPGTERWLAIPEPSRLQSVIDFVVRYSGSWRQALFEETLRCAGGSWLSLAVIPDDDRAAALDMVRAARYAGLIDMRHQDQDTVFAAALATGRPGETSAANPVMVLPDFSLVINEHVSSDQLYRSMQMGRLDSFDRVYRGLIDRGILGDSLARGVSGDIILEALTSWSAPPNVVETVREWIREFHRLNLSAQPILMAGDEKTALQIRAYGPLKEYLEPVETHAVFRIMRGGEARVREILQGLGFDVRMPGSEAESAPPRRHGELAAEPAGLWVPVVDAETVKREHESPPMRGTKYGAELKALDLSETVHVIDYAILTGQQIVIDYEGSPYIRDGTYTALPLSCQKGIDPTVEAEVVKTRSKKTFYIRKIRKIGVVPR